MLKTEYDFLDKLKIYKNYFLDPSLLKIFKKEPLSACKKAMISLFTLKDMILAENKILLANI